MYLFGVEVNFNSLRTDTYDKESRIPLVKAGTPQLDAFRRDFTINSLFYRLDTGEVEDWTGCGITDLQKGTVRTPLSPKETLTEDPLRVMRAIRFALLVNPDLKGYCKISNYKNKDDNPIFDPQLVICMSDEEIHSALSTKVSRERITKEFVKTVASPGSSNHSVATAFGMYHAFSLFSNIFPFSPPISSQSASTLHLLATAFFSKIVPDILSTLETHSVIFGEQVSEESNLVIGLAFAYICGTNENSSLWGAKNCHDWVVKQMRLTKHHATYEPNNYDQQSNLLDHQLS